jgi:hypothetical protein
VAVPKIGSVGAELDLLIKQGGTFGPVTVTARNPDATAMDLTGCTVRGQIRKKALDSTVVASFVCTVDPDQVANRGKFVFGLTDEVTAAIVADEQPAKSLFVWDMELEDGAGRVTPLYHGQVTVFREVTRA